LQGFSKKKTANTKETKNSEKPGAQHKRGGTGLGATRPKAQGV